MACFLRFFVGEMLYVCTIVMKMVSLLGQKWIALKRCKICLQCVGMCDRDFYRYHFQPLRHPNCPKWSVQFAIGILAKRCNVEQTFVMRLRTIAKSWVGFQLSQLTTLLLFPNSLPRGARHFPVEITVNSYRYLKSLCWDILQSHLWTSAGATLAGLWP